MEERLAYKVVTQDMRSLGLRRNPNILEFTQGEWLLLPKNEVLAGKSDWGGIWAAVDKGNARSLQRYMRRQYNQETRLFAAAIKDVLYENSYRLKTNGIYLIEEL